MRKLWIALSILLFLFSLSVGSTRCVAAAGALPPPRGGQAIVKIIEVGAGYHHDTPPSVFGKKVLFSMMEHIYSYYTTKFLQKQVLYTADENFLVSLLFQDLGFSN